MRKALVIVRLPERTPYGAGVGRHDLVGGNPLVRCIICGNRPSPDQPCYREPAKAGNIIDALDELAAALAAEFKIVFGQFEANMLAFGKSLGEKLGTQPYDDP